MLWLWINKFQIKFDFVTLKYCWCSFMMKGEQKADKKKNFHASGKLILFESFPEFHYNL